MLPVGNVPIRKSNKVQNNHSTRARTDLLRDVFFSPKSAFESYFQKHELGGRDLFVTHLSLAVLGILSKFVSNLIQIFVFKVTNTDEETSLTLFQGVFSVFAFYVLMIFVFRLLDSFRLYHKTRDRLTDWDGPEPHVFTVSFLPFTSTAIFWILPPPFPLVFVGIGALYSLQLSYMYLSMIRHWTTAEFFFFFLKASLFFLFLTFFPLLVYNIIRTVSF